MGTNEKTVLTMSPDTFQNVLLTFEVCAKSFKTATCWSVVIVCIQYIVNLISKAIWSCNNVVQTQCLISISYIRNAS